MKPLSEACPLCQSQQRAAYHHDHHRQYWQCQHCQLVFVTSEYWLSRSREKSEYDLHENEIADAGYLRFLRRLADPLVARVPLGASGLDLGCGPGPALQRWLQGQGHQVAVFDKFYAPNHQVFSTRYDYICATEVVEHLAQPGLTLFALWQLLVPGGILALMTKRVIDRQAFSRWHYKNDPTHIAFFSDASFRWLAEALSARLEFVAKDVVFLTKGLP